MQALYLLLGSNKGNRLQYIEKAKKELAIRIGNIEQQSAYYETAAWGNTQQASFINQAVTIYTDKPTELLLQEIKKIEHYLGRTETIRWGAREIDIDILLLGNTLLQTPLLTIPHADLHNRKFALIPLAEIAPNLIHPTFNQIIAELLQHCEDDLLVTVYE